MRRFNTLAGQALPVYAAPETLESLGSGCFPYAFLPQLTPEQKHKDAIYRPELLATPIDGPFDLLGRTWEPITLPHGKMRTLGFRIGDFAYCTDCNAVPAEAREKLRGLDVLIIDALRPREHPVNF